MKQTCDWPGDDPLMVEYHDREWGEPLHDDRKLFEFMVLDAFQAGLSWAIVLRKRDNFRNAFDDFDFNRIARYTPKKTEILMKDQGIIRNRLKIESTISNAKAFITLQKDFESFDEYIWKFTGGTTKINRWKKLSEIPSTSAESDAMSKDLKKRGFRFVGSTICYSFMQAAGMVNDHLVGCYRYKEINLKVKRRFGRE
jgi:DNA-3-methyladenine glycosylase I